MVKGAPDVLRSHLGEREFTVTEDHLKLLRRFNIRWEEGGYYGSPEVDQKRPYGNGDVLRDVAEILGWPLDDEEDGELPEEITKRAMAIHEQMADVLQIVIHAERFAAGRYVQMGWGEKWKPEPPSPATQEHPR